MNRLEAILSLPENMRLLEGAGPISIETPGAKHAFLVLHGFSGMPCELSIPAKIIASMGYAVYAPRYPGHGTCRADFMSSRAEDWLRRAVDSYLDLRARYDSVSVLGHSMGGLIGSCIAARFDVPRLILLAPAFDILGGVIQYTPLIAPFKPVIKRDRPLPENDRNDAARTQRWAEYGCDDLVLPASQLRRLQLLGRRILPDIKSRVLLIQGTKDEAVNPASPEWIKSQARQAASFDIQMLEGRSHVFPFTAGSDEMSAAIKNWLGGR